MNEEEVDEYGSVIDQYGDDYEYEYQADYGDNIQLEDRRDNEERNTQINQEGLYELILQEIPDLDTYTTFGYDWNFLYYYTCGWSKSVCLDFIDEEQTHIKLIGYTKEFVDCQGFVENGLCKVCCL